MGDIIAPGLLRLAILQCYVGLSVMPFAWFWQMSSFIKSSSGLYFSLSYQLSLLLLGQL